MRYVIMLLALFVSGLQPALAADNPVSPESSEQVIQPAIDRRDITVPHIRARDFEVELYVGQYNAESFGVQPVYGTRLGYHLSEDYFVEFAYGLSTISDQNFRHLGIGLFSEENSRLTYYYLSAGANLLPGEIFLGRGRAWGTTLYLSGGIGSTSFDTFDRITMNVAVGLRILPTKSTSVRIDIRNHIYESDLLGENRFMQNLEITGALCMHF